MLSTRGKSASPRSVRVGAPFQQLSPSSTTGILHRRCPAPVAWNPTTQCRSFLRTEGKVIDNWPKRSWQAPIRPSANRGSSRFLHLGANTGPDVCGLFNNRSIIHHAFEGNNYKSMRCMGVNSDDRKFHPSCVKANRKQVFVSQRS